MDLSTILCSVFGHKWEFVDFAGDDDRHSFYECARCPKRINELYDEGKNAIHLLANEIYTDFKQAKIADWLIIAGIIVLVATALYVL